MKMKRKLIVLTISLLMLFSSTAWAISWDNFMWCKSSGEQTADATVYTGTCFLVGVIILTDGSNDATAILYDNTASSGTKIWEAKIVSSDQYGGGMLPYPIYCETGIRVDLTGTGASAIVFYRESNQYKQPR